MFDRGPYSETFFQARGLGVIVKSGQKDLIFHLDGSNAVEDMALGEPESREPCKMRRSGASTSHLEGRSCL